MKYNIDKLIADNNQKDFLFFWGHRPSKDGKIIKSCLSQWWLQSFTEGESTYYTAEHYMMAGKAILFEDQEAFNDILKEKNPKAVKNIGRRVKNFYQDDWEKNRFNIVVQGNYLKFSQNSLLREYLLSTENKIIVEASPYDRIWGVGMTQDDKKINDPQAWKGLNLLGFALMEVRDKLRIEN